MTSWSIAGNTSLASREWSRIRLGCTAASVAMFTAAVVVLGALTPGYNQWSDTVSRLGSPGERWALVGANGSGKTMLLKLLRGDKWPTPTGKEKRTYRLGGGEQNSPGGIKELIAYVGPERQDKYVRYDWDLSVEQIVTTGLFDEDVPLTKPTAAQRAKVERILRRFQLTGLRKRSILRLSYGQRRRTLVARAFAGPAKVLLLDEVFNGLDDAARRSLKRALEQPRSGHDWVVTSHRVHELLHHVAVEEAEERIAGIDQRNLHAELGQVVAGSKPGRERDDETILLWHRGLSITDIALGHALLEKGKRESIGTRLSFA